MKYHLLENGDLLLTSLEPSLRAKIEERFSALLLQKKGTLQPHLVPQCPSDPEFREYWEEFGAPEIDHLLNAHHQQTLADLSQGANNTSSFLTELSPQETLVIPKEHYLSWLRVLNMARISLAIEYNFGEEELSSHQFSLSQLGSLERQEAFLLLQFFTILQQFLVELEEEK